MKQPTDGIKTFASRLFDYAGLYPPASLELDEAVRRYYAHRSNNYGWMLGPFVIHAARLHGLRDLLKFSQAVDLSILAGVGGAADFEALLQNDLGLISEFRSARAGNPGFDFSFQIETAVPRASFENVVPESFLTSLADGIAHFELPPQHTFIEVPLTASGPSLERWAAAIVETNATGDLHFALKARCGGITADAVPSVEQLVTFLLVSAQVRCPFKATAGLHHPVRGQYFTESIPMHGFLNVFGGAALVYESLIGGDDLRSLLNEQNPDALSLDNRGFAWSKHVASPQVLARCRDEFALSIGSCSFSEPVRDLETMGVLSC